MIMNNQSIRDVGKRIKFIREQLGLSQAAFADKIGRDASTVTKLEKGKMPLSARIKKAIRDEFCVRGEYLEQGDEPIYDDRWAALDARARDLNIHVHLAALRAKGKAYDEIIHELFFSEDRRPDEPGIYIKNEGTSTSGEGMTGYEVATPARVDLEFMREVIEVVMGAFEKYHLHLPPEKFAQLIILIYEEFLDDKSKRGSMPERVLGLTKLAS